MIPTSSSTRPRHRRDVGATLTELLISTIVIGLLAGAMLSLVAVFLRNDQAASVRIGESRDLQQLYVYFPGDVSSASQTELVKDANGDGLVDANDPATAAPCAGYTGGGVNALDLKWSERFGATTTQYRVNYRVETVSTERRIVRIECHGVSLGTATVLIVARRLDPTADVVVFLDRAMVVLRVTEKTGAALTITATSNNPNGALESSSEFDV